MMNEMREMKEHEMKYESEERKSKKRDEKMPAKSSMKKDGGLKAVTLEGSGRACYPKLKKMTNKPY